MTERQSRDIRILIADREPPSAEILWQAAGVDNDSATSGRAGEPRRLIENRDTQAHLSWISGSDLESRVQRRQLQPARDANRRYRWLRRCVCRNVQQQAAWTEDPDPPRENIARSEPNHGLAIHEVRVETGDHDH